jgi:cytochrome oxidase Cu insertion factor (SCO1/SenC/PrrC family)
MPKTLTEKLAWLILLSAMLVATGFFIWSETRRPRAGVADNLADGLIIDRPVGPFQLTNQFAAPVTHEALKGSVWVTDVIFTRCPGQCHQLSSQLREVQKRLPPGSPVKLVSLTADPSHDTPEVLAEYAQRYGYETNNWMLLTGSKASVYSLAIKGLLFSVVEQPEGKRQSLNDLFIHSTAFALVDRRGHLRGVVQGEMTNAVDEILRRVDLLVREGTRP